MHARPDRRATWEVPQGKESTPTRAIQSNLRFPASTQGACCHQISPLPRCRADMPMTRSSIRFSSSSSLLAHAYLAFDHCLPEQTTENPDAGLLAAWKSEAWRRTSFMACSPDVPSRLTRSSALSDLNFTDVPIHRSSHVRRRHHHFLSTAIPPSEKQPL